MNYNSKSTKDKLLAISCEHALDIGVCNFAHALKAKYIACIVNCDVVNENQLAGSDFNSPRMSTFCRSRGTLSHNAATWSFCETSSCTVKNLPPC